MKILSGKLGFLLGLENYLALYRYIGNIVPMKQTGKTKTVERVQIGARMEKTLVKTLKALAEYLDLSLGDLLEGITLHARADAGA